jgi:SAM-dependent methyltransferase
MHLSPRLHEGCGSSQKNDNDHDHKLEVLALENSQLIMDSIYEKEFYMSRQSGSRRSAEIIVPLLLDLVVPKSVIDVGCGIGSWLSVFKEHGIDDILGVDGKWVDKKLLMIPCEKFISSNLEEPIEVNRRFDLVVSLEVAEHIRPEHASSFVKSLVDLGPVILFSAAIPLQVGKHHVNEQWPDYWVMLFKEHRYVAVDAIRRQIWQNENVEYWYAQNILIFADLEAIKSHPALYREMKNTSQTQLSLVHPKMYLLNSAPIRIILGIPFLNSLFLNIVTGKTIRSIIRKCFLKREK